MTGKQTATSECVFLPGRTCRERLPGGPQSLWCRPCREPDDTRAERNGVPSWHAATTERRAAPHGDDLARGVRNLGWSLLTPFLPTLTRLLRWATRKLDT